LNQPAKKRVVELIEHLSSPERGLLDQFLSAFNRCPDRGTKLSTLLNYHYNQKHHPSNELSPTDVVPKATNKNYELLEEKLLDSLLLDINLDREGRYREEACLELALQKEYMKVQLLHSRGAEERSYFRLNRLIERFVDFENYDQALSCLKLQLGTVCLQQNPSEFSRQRNLLVELKRKQQLRDKALDVLAELRQKKYYGILENLDLFLELNLTKLHAYSAQCASKSIIYVKHYFEKELAELSGDFLGALKHVKHMQKLLDQSFHMPEVSGPYELMYEEARLLIQLNAIDRAAILLYQTVQNLPIENQYGQAALELLFVLELSREKLSAAEKLIQHFSGSVYFELHMPAHARARWHYYVAILYFRQAHYRRCITYINRHIRLTELSIDKRLKIKLIEILSCVASLDHDEADRLQESLRKYMKRNKLSESLNASHLTELCNILWQLKYCGYDLHRLGERSVSPKPFIEMLDGLYLRVPLHLSIIRWDIWFKRSMNQKNHAQTLFERTLLARQQVFSKTGSWPQLCGFG
jgi:hypothetical protein